MKWHKPTEHPKTGRKIIGILKTDIQPEVTVDGITGCYDFLCFSYGDFFKWYGDTPITHAVLRWAEIPEAI